MRQTVRGKGQREETESDRHTSRQTEKDHNYIFYKYLHMADLQQVGRVNGLINKRRRLIRLTGDVMQD